MPGFGDEIDAVLAEDDGEASGPVMRPTRRTVLDEVRVEGDPSGRRGRSSMGRGGRVETGPEVDSTAPLADVPETPMTVLPEVRIEAESPERRRMERQQARDSQFSPLWDAWTSISPLYEPDRAAARARTGERVSDLWDAFVNSPREAATYADRMLTDDLAGSSEGTVGEYQGDRAGTTAAATNAPLVGPWVDEIAAGARSMRGGRSYEQELPRVRSEIQRAEEQNPSAFGAGRAAGIASQVAIPGMAATSGAGRVGVAALESGLMGLNEGAGRADPDASLSAGDAMSQRVGAGLQTGGAAALGGGAMGLGGEAVRGGLRALGRIGEGRDELLLSATGSAGGNSAAVRAFDRGDDPRQIAASRASAAQVLRDTGAVPALGGMRSTADSIAAARDRAIGTLDDVRTAMGVAGPQGTDVARRLRERAASMREVTDDPIRNVLNDFADRYGDPEVAAATGSRAPSEPLPYDALVANARGLRRQGAWRTRAGQDVPLREEGLRMIDDELRDAYDDALESTLGQGNRGALTPEQQAAAERLGMDPREAYRRARQQYAVLRTADQNAQAGVASTAGNRAFGFTEQVLGSAGATAGATVGSAFGPTGAATGSALGALAGTMGGRALRATGPRLRATGAELAYRIASTAPQRFGRSSQIILDAARRGSTALESTVYVLSQRDARFRQELERAMSEDPEDATPEAVRRIGESGDF